jgi:hypothetical protein
MHKIALTALAAFALTSAANANIFIHGRNSGRDNPARVADNATGVVNTDGRYWTSNCGQGSMKNMSSCSTVVTSPVNADGNGTRFLNWDGVNRVLDNANLAVNPLKNAVASGNTWILHSHSTGGLIVDRYIQLYGSSRIRFAFNSSSAAGGSELASIYNQVPIDNNLEPANARSFSHASGATIYHYGGSNSNPEMLWLLGSAVSSATLKGEDDGAVGYHSTLGKASQGTWCDGDSVWYNPASYGCTAWNKGTQYAGHVAKVKEYQDHRWGVGRARGY